MSAVSRAAQREIPVSSPMLDAQPELSAQDILARLERYAAAHRAGVSGVASVRIIETPRTAPKATPALAPDTDDFQPHDLPRRRIDPATADLFPYDLAATIVGCVLTIFANMLLPGPLAIAVTVALLVGAEASRRRRWFPSAGVNLMLGIVAGALLVLTA